MTSKRATSKSSPKRSSKSNKDNEELIPILPLNNVVGLPSDLISFTLQNSSLINIVKTAHENDRQIFTTCSKLVHGSKSRPIFGTLARIAEITEDKAPKKLRFRLNFLKRAELCKMSTQKKIPMGEIRIVEREGGWKEDEQKAVRNEIEAYIDELSVYVNTSGLKSKIDLNNLDFLIACLARTLEFTHDDKVKFLDGWSIKKRCDLLLEMLAKYLQIHKLRKKLRDKTNDRIKKMEKDAFLQEEKKIIENELSRHGHKSCPPEYQELKDNVENFSGPTEVARVLDREFAKLLRSGPHSPHSATTQDYIETLLELPWETSCELETDWKKVEKSLKDSHFGLDKVKDKILRYLAVHQITTGKPGSIICFVGPPGVGKTSFARAIAEALELPYIKKSLGGVRDESEIRGHRRTYVGSLPGRIIQGIKKCGVNNPVFCLDEVDKMGQDQRGNPADALLEVLDPEENHSFSDHYVELDFDLSKVFWILTANSESAIPAPLRDRMEIIRFSGYTEYEKVHIVREYMIDRIMKKNGLEEYSLNITEDTCKKIIRQYTREAGVRELDRKISNLIQHLALKTVRGNRRKKWTISSKSLTEVFGPAEYKRPAWTKTSWTPGVMAGLAWTASGGTILRLECTIHDGKGVLKLTGKLGEVMKESAHTAYSFIKRNREKLGLELDFQKQDIHIHIPSGAVSKEGPSAGMGLALLMYSALSHQKSIPFWALTGEISLHGNILAIGGVREKILAAQQEGFQGVVLPKANEPNVLEIDPKELDQLKIIYVKNFWEAHFHFFNFKK